MKTKLRLVFLMHIIETAAISILKYIEANKLNVNNKHINQPIKNY